MASPKFARSLRRKLRRLGDSITLPSFRLPRVLRRRPRLPEISAPDVGIESAKSALGGFRVGLAKLFSTDNTYETKLALLIGLTSIVGFVIDFLVTALPPRPFEASWRLDVLRLVGDRGIVLLFGLALLGLALQVSPQLKKPFTRLCLLLGLLFWLSGAVVFQSVLSLRDQAVVNISQQSSQALNQLRAAEANPPSLGAPITPEQIEQATEQVNQQADTLVANATSELFKTLAFTIGNLTVAGLALIILSRLA